MPVDLDDLEARERTAIENGPGTFAWSDYNIALRMRAPSLFAEIRAARARAHPADPASSEGVDARLRALRDKLRELSDSASDCTEVIQEIINLSEGARS